MKKFVSLVFGSVLLGHPVAADGLTGYETNLWQPASATAWVVPNLAETDQPETTTGAACDGAYGYWVGADRRSLIQCQLSTGTLKKISLPDRIYGLAWYADKQLLILRQQKSLSSLDPNHLTVGKTLAFGRTASWTAMTIAGANLYILEDEQITTYNLANLEPTDRWTTPKDKIQNIAALEGGRLILWSSYLGNKLLEVNATTGKITQDAQSPVPYRAFFKMVSLPGGQLGVLDPETSQFKALIKVGGSWLPQDERLFVRSDGLAFRQLDRREPLTGTLRLRAGEAAPAGRLLVSLPLVQTWGQEITDEALPTGDLQVDAFGNRYLALTVPALEAGQEFELPFFSGQLARFKVVFDLSSANRWEDLVIPDEMKVWLQDRPEFGLTVSPLKEERQALRETSASPADYLQTAYQAVLANLRYAQDGRFDPAPQTWEQGSGSCTEFSRVFNHLLRGSGIPARIVRNWLPVDGHQPRINHKVAEGWLPRLGWFPLEALSPPRTAAGTTSGLHLLFSITEKDRDGLIPNDGLYAWSQRMPADLQTEVVYNLPERETASAQTRRLSGDEAALVTPKVTETAEGPAVE